MENFQLKCDELRNIFRYGSYVISVTVLSPYKSFLKNGPV